MPCLRRLPFAVLMAGLIVGGAAGATSAGRGAGVVVRVLQFVDDSRLARYQDGTSGPRVLNTSVWFPLKGHRPFPLIVFGHGFAAEPADFARLLVGWTRAGYVVAAPQFPVENANAPGGPDESDLINQPADVSFVISQLLAAGATGSDLPRGLIDPARIAVASQSDGGD